MYSWGGVEKVLRFASRKREWCDDGTEDFESDNWEYEAFMEGYMNE